MRRVTAGISGFLIAPLVPAIVAASTSSLVARTDIVGQLLMVFVFYIYALFFTLLLGLPLFLLFLRFKLIRWWSTMGVGLAAGALMAFFIGPPSPSPSYVLFMAATGTATALAFWLIWRRGKDRAAPSG